MAVIPGMLLAYDDDGNVIATQDYRTLYDEFGEPLGLVDYAAHEEAGGEMTDVWVVATEADGVTTPAKGSKVWPEYIGAAAHQFRVELVGPPGAKRIGALVHKVSGHRRERAVVEGEIARRIAEAGDGPADIRDLVGGPDRHLPLDEEGRTRPRVPEPQSALPVLRNRGHIRE